MPYTTCYIDLYDNTNPTSIPDIQGQQFSNFGSLAGWAVAYSWKPVTTKQQYNAFLYNPVDSNKLLKIKTLDFKYPSSAYGSAYYNIIIGRAKDLSTGSIEDYDKFDSTSPDLPAGVGLTLNPLTTYTALTGSFRQRSMQYTNQVQSQFTYRGMRNNTHTFYEAQKIGTVVQDFTLNANEHMVIAYSTNAYANTKYQISVTFSSGSNTYYYDIATSTTNFYVNALNQYDRYPAAFVNNSSTPIKIHKIEINQLYSDFGAYTMGFTAGALATKQLMIEKVTADRIPSGLADTLINSDSYPIIELDTNNSIPSGIKCYKHSVRVQPTFNQVWGLGNEVDITIPIYLRTSMFNVGNFMTGLAVTNTSPFGIAPAININSVKSRYSYNNKNGEIIIRPGEGLGLLLHNNSNTQDAADGAIFGHIQFTVEDVPTTAIETGFGY